MYFRNYMLAPCKLTAVPCYYTYRSSCRFADQNTAFACGGSGSLFKSADGGKSWKRDKATDNGVAGNLYAIKFTGAAGKNLVLQCGSGRGGCL